MYVRFFFYMSTESQQLLISRKVIEIGFFFFFFICCFLQWHFEGWEALNWFMILKMVWSLMLTYIICIVVLIAFLRICEVKECFGVPIWFMAIYIFISWMQFMAFSHCKILFLNMVIETLIKFLFWADFQNFKF